MATYTRNKPGAPTSGRYAIGDAVTDSLGNVWSCIVAGPAALDGSSFALSTLGATVLDSRNTGANGTANGATVSAAEYSAGPLHRTVLTLTATPITITDEAGISQWGGAGKIYDFPEGWILIQGAIVNGNLTLGTTGTIINTFTSVFSLGSVAASATGAATLVTTAADILKQFSASAAVAKVAAVKGGPVATQITEAGALWYDGHTTALDMYLNLKVADDATHTSGTGTFTGSVEFLWSKLGDA